MAHVLVATGLKREARIVAQPGVVAIAGGGVEADLETWLEANTAGAIGIASFGLAGALREGLAIGDWLVATRLIGAVEAETDAAWREAALARLPGARTGVAYADGRMLASVAEKRRLRAQADMVDMESHVAARIALRHGLPFAVIRCISDRADHLLPPAIQLSMKPGGGIDAAAMLGSLLRQPAQLPDLLAAMIHGATALRALAEGSSGLGTRLAIPARVGT